MIDGESVMTAPELVLELEAAEIVDATLISLLIFGQELRVKASRYFKFQGSDSFYLPKLTSYGQAAVW